MPIPKAIVRLVLERDDHQCVIRGPRCTGLATVADHRANRGSGGSKVLNSPAALVAACQLDNGWKEDATGSDLAGLIDRGVRVPKAATNAQTLRVCQYTPVTYPNGSRYWLTTSGERLPADSPTPF